VTIDSAYVSALSAMGGAVIGALSSLSTSWFTFRSQTRSQRSAHKIERLQDLYKDFIEQASKFYADSLIHSSTDVLQLIQLYVLISRMRVLSSPVIVEHAERAARAIVENYLSPNKSFAEIREMANQGKFDPLRDFSIACREELNRLEYS
jgi:hypothetical protein